MHLAFTPEDEVFRQEVRAFIAAALPAEIAERSRRGYHAAKADMQFWSRALAGRGWSAPHWPQACGGTGWPPIRAHIFEEEAVAADAPPLSVFGLMLVGPVIYTFGSEAQKRQHLPPILTGDVFWCQGFSEPGAGSDLASLKTTAKRDGDHYVVSGQKIWTTEAHYADMLFCLVRTDSGVRPQEGISFLLIDMKSPGIAVSPIVTLDEGHSVNQVFLDEVRVPTANLVGQENKGWSYAKFLLGKERTGNAQVPRSKRDLARLKDIARREQDGERPLIEDPQFRIKVAQAEIDLMALEFSLLRALSEPEGSATPGLASVLKIRGSELQQRLSGLMAEALGSEALPFHPDPDRAAPGDNIAPFGPDYAPGVMAVNLYRRAATIYAGSNEVQRNIIAKSVFGL